MGMKENQLVRSFELSARSAQSMEPLPTKTDGTAYSPEVGLDIAIQKSLSYALLHSFSSRYAELGCYRVATPLPDDEQDSYRFTIYEPDDDKESIEAQKVVYDTMDAFIRRLLKEGDNPDILRAQKDYSNQHITLHYQPQHLIDTLHSYAHKVLKGNETILGHLYMAQHLMDWQKDYRPGLQIN